MRISELSKRSDVTVASIKYYTRAGLISAGERTGYNTSEYDDAHVARLKLIRALITAGGLSIATVKEVLDAIDDEQMELGEVFGIAQRASSLMPDTLPSSEAVETVRQLAHDRGWQITVDNPGIVMTASALDSLHAIGRRDLDRNLDSYSRAVDDVAQADVSSLERSSSRADSAETLVVGTVLGDIILAGLRRVAHEHYSRRQTPQSSATPQQAAADQPASP